MQQRQVEMAPRFTQDLAPSSQLEGASARVRSAAGRGRLRGDKSCDFGRAAAGLNVARAKDERDLSFIGHVQHIPDVDDMRR